MAETGILIMNTGTPDAPTAEAIRPYLAEFLSDRAIISMPPILWQPILRLFILPSRPRKTIPRYESIWTLQGSPFLLTSESQRDKLASEFAARRIDADVQLGMRYGNPSVLRAITALREGGCSRLVVLPLFPQWARVTTQTCLDRVSAILDEQDWHPELVTIDHYCDQGAYLDLLADSIRSHWDVDGNDWSHRRLLFSFHSTLVKDIEAGDPYKTHAMLTCEGVAKRLDIPDDAWRVGWQCRFDSRKWLEPTPETILDEWKAAGIDDAAVVCPGFSTDCIETLVDCDVEQRERFEGGSRRYTYIPALGDSDAYIGFLADLVEGYLEG